MTDDEASAAGAAGVSAARAVGAAGAGSGTANAAGADFAAGPAGAGADIAAGPASAAGADFAAGPAGASGPSGTGSSASGPSGTDAAASAPSSSSEKTDALSPYTAVLLASYGGPRHPQDVLPFMRNATAGRNIPDERLLEVSQHYHLFGGRSPINEQNEDLRQALAAELARRGCPREVVVGNRNWTPYFSQTVEELRGGGHERVAALTTAAYSCYSSCRQYREDLAGAAREVPGIRLDKTGPYAERPGFISANAHTLLAAARAMRERLGQPGGLGDAGDPQGELAAAGQPGELGDAGEAGEGQPRGLGRMKVLFVTHSIPTAMNQASADGSQEARYDAQHMRVARRVAEKVESALGEELDWELTYCSRSGDPRVPWLEPDVNDRMEEIAGEVDGIVVAPIGFISDHMEVAYDLDTQARETAARIGVDYERAATAGTHPDFVSALADLLLEHAAVARGETPVPDHPCLRDDVECCLPGTRHPHAKGQ